MARTGTSIGVDISTGSVKVAEVNITRAEPVLNKLGIIMLPEGVVRDGEIEDPASIAGYLKELWKTNRFSRRKVILGVSNQKVIVRSMDLPYMAEEELDSAVRYQVQEFIPIPIEDAIIDFEVVDEFMTGEEERMQTVLLAAAHREMIQNFVDALLGAGLNPVAVELKAFAMTRSLLKREYQFLEEEGEAPGSVCLINIGSGISNICVVKEQTPRFVRMLMRGGDYFTKLLSDKLKLSPVDAEEIKQGRSTDKEANALLQREIQAFVGEIRRSLEFYISQTQERDLKKVIISGSGSRIINLPLELNRALRLPIEIGHPLQNVQLGKLPYTPEELAEMEASIAVCVGLALRDLEE
ncbi:MAG: type IV pilus assembly protein PilM [Actinomycetota bacterium]|nr:type IV pilus assembly protein PilM [Actinomycetota bacterium]